MSWNIGENRNLFLKLISKFGLYHVELTTPKTSPKKVTLTVVEMQQLPGIGKTESRGKISCVNWTIYNGRQKVCVNFKTDTDKFNFVVYRYRSSLYLKDYGIDLKLTKYQALLAKRVFLLSYAVVFYQGCIVLDDTAIHK